MMPFCGNYTIYFIITTNSTSILQTKKSYKIHQIQETQK